MRSYYDSLAFPAACGGECERFCGSTGSMPEINRYGLPAQVQAAGNRCRFSDHCPAADDKQPGRLQAQRFHRVAGLQDDYVGKTPRREPVAFQSQDLGAVERDGLDQAEHLCGAGHLGHVQAHVRHVQHVVGA